MVRKNISRMSQSEEKSWREERLTPISQSPARSQLTKISFQNVMLCLLGFAIIVGGPTYERVCYSTLETLRRARAHEGQS
jgi:hypothetical protein